MTGSTMKQQQKRNDLTISNKTHVLRGELYHRLVWRAQLLAAALLAAVARCQLSAREACSLPCHQSLRQQTWETCASFLPPICKDKWLWSLERVCAVDKLLLGCQVTLVRLASSSSSSSSRACTAMQTVSMPALCTDQVSAAGTTPLQACRHQTWSCYCMMQEHFDMKMNGPPEEGLS